MGTLDHLRLKLEVLESKCPGILDLINQKVDRKIREFSKSQGNSNSINNKMKKYSHGHSHSHHNKHVVQNNSNSSSRSGSNRGSFNNNPNSGLLPNSSLYGTSMINHIGVGPRTSSQEYANSAITRLPSNSNHILNTNLNPTIISPGSSHSAGLNHSSFSRTSSRETGSGHGLTGRTSSREINLNMGGGFVRTSSREQTINRTSSREIAGLGMNRTNSRETYRK